jgi:imidazolonepropionase-like amidohydrolase
VQFRAPGVLHQAGVTVAMVNDLGRMDAANQRNLPYMAAQAAAFGLPGDAALASITLIPAQLHGVADRLAPSSPARMQLSSPPPATSSTFDRK